MYIVLGTHKVMYCFSIASIGTCKLCTYMWYVCIILCKICVIFMYFVHVYRCDVIIDNLESNMMYAISKWSYLYIHVLYRISAYGVNGFIDFKQDNLIRHCNENDAGKGTMCFTKLGIKNSI